MATSTAHEVFKAGYRVRLERAAVIALLLLIFFFQLSPRFEVGRRPVALLPVQVQVEEVPVTRQVGALAPPPRPAVPVPVDDPALPLDETIDLTEISFQAASSSLLGGAPESSASSVTPPRPIAEVFPEYPKAARQKGAQGVVKVSLLVKPDGSVAEAVVVLNTTGSEECALAALRAARATRFVPGEERGVPVATWTTREYGFHF
ncbi:MAG: TonB family protein [bacterium]|jgi:TonB family protein|nr:energy transducer TonB [candidate division KSB1 bacterium]MDH7561097.1 TonB family protein [bacterium]